MAEVKFEKQCVKFCINCGAEFEKSQPQKESQDNIVKCDGCNIKFVSRTVEN